MKAKTNERKPDVRASLSVLRRILKDAKPILPRLLLAVLIDIAAITLTMIGPEILGRLTDMLYEYEESGTPIDRTLFLIGAGELALCYLGAAVLGIVMMSLMNHVVSRHYTCRIRTEMSEKIARIPCAYFDKMPSGDVIARMTNDVSVMGGSIHSILNILINGVLKLVMVTVIILCMNPLMAAVILVFVPLSLLLSSLLAAKSEKHFDAYRATLGKIYALTEEDFTGFDTVKAYNLEALQQKKHDALTEDAAARYADGSRLSGKVEPTVSLLNGITYVAICLVGGFLALRGTIGVGELVAFVLYAKLFAGPLESISNGLSMMQSTVAAARRVYEFLDEEEMREFPPEKLPEGGGSVVFDDVSFSYDEKNPLIEHLSLSVSPGQKVALVGPTGGGKTTIVNLLMRFYDPTGGRILVDGKDTKTMNRQDVRSEFAMVLQDTWLFSGTVYENIAYGKEDATEEEVLEAARRAHVDDFVRTFSDGYSTRINEETNNLSAGQKQLLTIARAYLSGRKILILDEATSNVDTRTEILIQNTMDDLMRNKTSFVIAHRLSTIVDADVILVIDNGKVVESGTHETLLKKGGLYSEIYHSQYALLK